LRSFNPDVVSGENKSETENKESKDTSMEKPAQETSVDDNINITPLAKNLADKNEIDISTIKGSGRSGKIAVDDINEKLNTKTTIPETNKPVTPSITSTESLETRKRITKRRETIAKRLKEAHLNTVMTTTYSEVDMTEIRKIRAKYKESFREQKGVGLGFMSFFVKSVVQSLIDFPNRNSEMGENEIIMKNYYKIGITVASDEGLVVPVLKNANNLSFSGIESGIVRYG
jgi:Pyruvate/2-oxoglutarate dehydrogenase complex, dihydrolipoamide acyltransferase (E2) component, and related enzymes